MRHHLVTVINFVFSDRLTLCVVLFIKSLDSVVLPVCLVHLANELVDECFTVTMVTALNKVGGLAGAETAIGTVELEWPKKVGGSLKVGTDRGNLVDQVLHADNVMLAQGRLDDRVVSQGDALLVDFAITALVDQVTDGL